MSEFRVLKKTLSRLSKQELQEIITAARFLSGGGKTPVVENPKPQLQGDKEIVQGLLLFAKKHVVVPPISTLNTSTFLALTERLNIASIELRKICTQLKLNRIQSMKLCKVTIDTAIVSMIDRQTSLSFNALINKIADPKYLLDDSYPGYGPDIFKRFVLNV